MTRFDTKLAHLGRESARNAQTVNPPVTRASTILFDSVDELYGARGEVPYEANRYGIYGTTTQFELQSAMAELSNTESCLATASGLSAIAATLSAHATPGGRLLIANFLTDCLDAAFLDCYGGWRFHYRSLGEIAGLIREIPGHEVDALDLTPDRQRVLGTLVIRKQ